MNGPCDSVALSGRASDRPSRTALTLRGADHLRHGGAASAGVIAAPDRDAGRCGGAGLRTSLAHAVNPRSGVACGGGSLGNLRRRPSGVRAHAARETASHAAARPRATVRGGNHPRACRPTVTEMVRTALREGAARRAVGGATG